jgi:arylsulfatase A-like enzyme
MDHLDEAVVVEESHRPLQVHWLEVGFDRRRALLQHPPSAYVFEGLPSGESARLAVAPTMNPASWTTGTDGVGFEARCLGSSGDWVDLLDLAVSPAERPEDRVWHQRELPLAGCSSPRTSIELRTTCGPGADCRWDWAYWGDPRVVAINVLQPELERLALLVSIDTLRPDRTSLYGSERTTTPELERLAADGIVFETAVAPAPWTIPSHASLLTSTDPGLHGATAQHDIHPGLPLLSEVFQRGGWATAGFVDTPWLSSFGFDRGYDHYDADSPPPGSTRRGAAVTRQRLLDWLAGVTGDAFIFWHVMDAHGAYGAPAPFGGRFRRDLEIAHDGRLEALRQLAYHDYLRLERFRSFDDLLAAYDEGIAATDAEVGLLLEVLRQAGLYDDALIVVTSDHGESLMDHGVWVGHGLFLTEDEIRVPLVIKLPANRWAGTRVEEMVRLIDVAPTILEVLRVPKPRSFGGQSLVHPGPGTPRALPKVAFGTSTNTGAHYVRSGELKLITDWTASRDQVVANHLRPKEPTPLTARIVSEEQLYDLSGDAAESRNLRGDPEWTDRAHRLRDLLRRHDDLIQTLRRGLATSSAEVELSPEQIRQLESLGYLGGEKR